MPTFYAQDNEFAASTGSNVNNNYNGGNSSQFDYPPNATKDFSVTSDENDAKPGLFEVGETYSVEWKGGPGGGAYIEDAVVIRSDTFDQTSGVIVFEGLDENGDLTQVVWSPGYDLEQWYWDNYSGGQSPGFYTTDMISGDHSIMCFTSGTMISTPSGPKRVEELRIGEWVHTVDHGLQPIMWTTDRLAPGIGKSSPVEFSAGLFGSAKDVGLSPEHRVLVSDYQCELLFGSRCVYASAKSLVGLPGVCFAERPLVRYVHVLLPIHAAIFANGMPCESLLAGDVTMGALGPAFQNVYAKLSSKLGDQNSAYPCLKHQQGRLLASILVRDAIGAKINVG